ncbi:flagellar hook-basal body complex protein FliE [Shinella daejeonensis]|uniref:flagellar hook-basal body complex protein FliE n=1 Tax=Shinella daejeonensis TaxID=659017 RepID=UPI0020C7E440|nr:flagellar hook-basal body complex protein FliE [Shinella daejeonensis]MCP8896804.1 flagellar hook-basal body complex protein FliE [Shinella daejeonensis]
MIETVKGIGSPFSSDPVSAVVDKAGNAAAAGEGVAAPQSFAQVLGDMATDMATSLKVSETKSFEAIQGKASTREVVDAVMNAEQALQTAIAIRDKVVTAYLEVTRMQI